MTIIKRLAASYFIFFVLALTVSGAPRPPMPPWPELPLYRWAFDEPYAEASTSAAAARRVDSTVWRESWSGYALNRSGRLMLPADLPMRLDSGYPLVASDAGSIRFWFCPDWSSGKGAGRECRFLEVATVDGRESATWWTLRVDALGEMLQWAAQTETGLTERLKAPIQWNAGEWHLITLAYSPTNTVLYLDGQFAALGQGLMEIPQPVLPLTRLIIGSDATGQMAAGGQFEELATFAGAYPAWLLAVYYQAMRWHADWGTDRVASTLSRDPRGRLSMASVPEPPGGGGGSTNQLVPVYPVTTNGLRLAQPALTNGAIYLTILGGTNNAVYDLFATVAVTSNSLAHSTWHWLGAGHNSNTYAFSEQTNPAAFYLFGTPLDGDNDGLSDAWETLISRSCPTNSDSDGDGLLDGWEWRHFGDFTQTASGDYDQDGLTNGEEQQYQTDPNTVQFRLEFPVLRTYGAALTGTVEVVAGVPAGMAVLVNDTNFSNATWSEFASNFVVNLAAEGEHAVWVGARGRAANSSQRWLMQRLIRDTTPPVLVITEPLIGTLHKPMIQLRGYSPEPLSRIAYTLSNGLSTAISDLGIVVDEIYDPAARKVTTNYFECADLELTPGTNRLHLTLTDHAGNVTETNLVFVYDQEGDTNAPVISLPELANGLIVSGDSLTLRGLVDDETATIITVVSGGGATNMINGFTERNGTLWVEAIPLAQGTNHVWITAVDAAGKVGSTNLALVKSAVTLTLGPLPESELHKLTTTVTGVVANTTYAVVVNGVAAQVSTGGGWVATNVPVNTGGTAAFHATATPPGGGSAETIHAWLYQDKPPRVWVDCYDSAFSYQSSSSTGSPIIDLPDVTKSVQFWQDRLGGGGESVTGFGQPPNTLFYTNQFAWPPDTYEPTLNGTNWLPGGEPEAIDPLAVSVEQCDITGVLRSDDDIIGTFSRNAHATVKLFTGGKQVPKRKSLFALSGTVTERDWQWNFCGGEPTNWAAVEPGMIRLGAFGPLDASNIVYTSISEGREVVLTPIAQGTPNQAGTLPEAVKYKLRIYRGGQDVTAKTSTVWIGEQMTLQCAMDPDLPSGMALTNLLWTVPGGNAQRIANFIVAPRGDYGTNVPLTTLTNNNVSCYWVDSTNAAVFCSAKANGEILTAVTVLNVEKPTADWIGITNGPVLFLTNDNDVLLSYGIGTNQPGIKFVFTNKYLAGFTNSYRFFSAQLMVPEWRANGYDATGGVVGARWFFRAEFGLDTLWPYRDFATNAVGQAEDSPSFYATPNAYLLPLKFLQKVVLDNDFRHYLFFQPNGGIPVAVKRIDWDMFVVATNSGASNRVDTILTNSYGRVTANNTETHGNPTWFWGGEAPWLLMECGSFTNAWYP